VVLRCRKGVWVVNAIGLGIGILDRLLEIARRFCVFSELGVSFDIYLQLRLEYVK
jgi:hypothetical protein